MRTAILAIFLALLVAAPLVGGPYSDLYVIPVASHVSGEKGTLWVSDVALQNFQATPLTVQLFYIASGQSSSENIANLVTPALPTGSTTVPAGGSVLLTDVLNNFEGRTNGLIGALIVSADKPFAVTSRAYTTVPSGGSAGQTVPGVSDFVENTLGDTNTAAAVAYVPGLVSNSRYRTNLGFVAGAGAGGLRIVVTVRGADGASVGTRTFFLSPNGFTHVQFPSGGTFEAGSAEFRIADGDGAVAPYASVVDNVTSNASFINGVFPPNTPFGASALVGSVFRRAVERLRY
jgi:hypothetical protein